MECKSSQKKLSILFLSTGCLLLILLLSFLSHLLFLLSKGTALVAFEAGLYVAVGAWLGLYSLLIVYVAAVVSSTYILHVPIFLALLNNLLIPLEALGIMLLVRTDMIDIALESLQDWFLFAAVQFLVVVPVTLFYVEINATYGYWPHVWTSLGLDLLFRLIVSHMSGGVLLGGLLIMWFTNRLKEKGLYVEHFFT